MWEITLIGEKNDFVYFLLLEDLISERLKVKPLFAISGENKLTCSIALKDKKFSKTLKNTILEIIIRICKEEYFKENIKFLGNDKELNKFIILSLTNIGLYDEIHYAFIKTRLSKKIHIRSLMNFKLSKLYNIWDKMINYFNLSFIHDNGEHIYMDFLKFLADNSKTSQIMYLNADSDSLCILDKNKKLLSLIPKNDEIGVIVNLIIHSPKKLIVSCYDSLSLKITRLIEYIFEDKVCILL